MFGGGGAPKESPAVMPKPKEADPAIQKAAADARAERRRARGYKSTILRNNLMSDETANSLETLGS